MEYKIANPNKATDSLLFKEETGCALFTKDNDFYISGCSSQEEAEALIAAHNPPAPKKPTVQEKLATVGLSVNDLKSALGI